MTDIPLFNAFLFAALGIALFLASFAIASKFTPFDLWKEIQERNVAAAILAGAVALALGWIIAATMH